MNGSETVSVIIPTYNRKDVLLRAIKSVLDQTYPIYEIMVVDDTSDFDAEAYLKENLGDDCSCRIKVIRNIRNLGGAQSRNIGVENTSGEFVAFLDSDDYWLPDKIEKQMRVFQFNSDVGLVYCDLLRVDKPRNCVRSNRQLFDDDIWRRLLDGWTTFPNTSNLLFKKDVFLELGGFDAELTSCQDHDLWMRVGLSGIKVKYIPDAMSVVTKDAANRVSTDYPRRLEGVRRFLFKWQDHISTHKGEKHFRWYRNRYMVTAAFEIFIAKIRNREIRSAAEIYWSLFLLNPEFYKRLIQRLKSSISSGEGLGVGGRLRQ